MLDFKKIYEEAAEDVENAKAARMLAEEEARKYVFVETPVDIPSMTAEGKISVIRRKADYDQKVESLSACDYEFRFKTVFATARKKLILPEGVAGDACTIRLFRRRDWNDSSAALALWSGGGFVRCWVFRADIDQMLTLWLYGTESSENQSIDPAFLVRTFRAKIGDKEPAEKTYARLDEQLYSKDRVVDLVTNDLKFKHLHRDHPERVAKLQKLILPAGGYVGKPLIVAQPGQRRNDERPYGLVITDQNFAMVYDRGRPIADENMFDIYRCRPLWLIYKFYSLGRCVVENNNRPFGRFISKGLVNLAVRDQIAGLCDD